MLDGLKRKVAGGVLASVLKSLATNADTRTSVTGILAGAVLAVHGLNLSALIAGDPQQIALVASSLVVAVLGFVATKESHDGHATLLGVVAAALQVYAGDVTSAVALAVCGYFTNKPVGRIAPRASGGATLAGSTGAIQ
jgi:ABC-type uncharacterized transport system permease subunit